MVTPAASFSLKLQANLHAFSPLAVSSARAFHLALGPHRSLQLGLRPLLRRLFPEIVSYLLFQGREVPRDGSLEEAVEQCVEGGLVLVRGDHQLAVPLRVRKAIRIEGVMSVRPSSGSKQSRLPMIHTRFVLGCARQQGEKQIELCNLHVFRPGGLMQGGKKEDQHQSICFDIGMFIYPRTHVTSRSCIIEESPLARSGYGVFVRERASWTASQCAVRQAMQVGVLVQGIVHMDYCEVSGSKTGICVEGNGAAHHYYAGSDDALLSLSMVNCLLHNNDEMGIKLPMHNIFPAGSFQVTLAKSTVEGSTYPVAQDQTVHGYHEWLESVDDMVGLHMDEDTLLQGPLAEEERRQMGDDDDAFSISSFRPGTESRPKRKKVFGMATPRTPGGHSGGRPGSKTSGRRPPRAKTSGRPSKPWKDKHLGADIHDPNAQTSMTPAGAEKLQADSLFPIRTYDYDPEDFEVRI